MCIRFQFYTHQRVLHFLKKSNSLYPFQQTSSSSAFSSQIPVIILSGLSSDDRSIQIVLLTYKLNLFLTHSVVKVENNHAERKITFSQRLQTIVQIHQIPIFKVAKRN